MANANDQLTRLAALDPKRANSYCAETNTVRVMRKVYARRANGQIIGANSGPGSYSWKETRVQLADALQFAERAEKARVHNIQVDLDDAKRAADAIAQQIQNLELEIQGIEAGFSAVPEQYHAVLDSQISERTAKIAALRS